MNRQVALLYLAKPPLIQLTLSHFRKHLSHSDQGHPKKHPRSAKPLWAE